MESFPDKPSVQVLIIEDDFFACDAMAARLERDFTIRVDGEVHSTEDAIRWLNNTPLCPHVLLLDLDFPDGHEHGLALVQSAKEAFPELRICCLTLRSSPQLFLRALELGADGMLQKNECGDALGLAVSQCLSGDCILTATTASWIHQEKIPLSTLKDRNLFILPSIFLPHDLPNHLKKVAYLRYVRGLTSDQIGEELVISPYTVNDYLKQIKVALDLSGRSHLITHGFYSITHLLWRETPY